MSLLHMDGFDRYASKADVSAAGYSFNQDSWIAYQATGGRFGGVAIESRRDISYIQRGFGASSVVITGLSAQLNELDNPVEGPFLRWIDGSTVTHELKVDTASSELIALVDGSEVDRASVSLTVGAWSRYEVLIEIDGSTGRFIVEVNQQRLIDFSGDTQAGSSTTINGLRFSSNELDTKWWFDDLVVMDDAGTQLNDLIGDARIYTQAPDSDVAANWTPSGGGDNHDDVDEVPNDGDTSYVEASAADVRDEYAVADLPGDVTTVHAVKAAAWARKTDANSRSLEVGVGSGASEDLSAGQGLGSAYGRIDHIVEVDPDGGGAWTPSAVNGLTVIQETA